MLIPAGKEAIKGTCVNNKCIYGTCSVVTNDNGDLENRCICSVGYSGDNCETCYCYIIYFIHNDIFFLHIKYNCILTLLYIC